MDDFQACVPIKNEWDIVKARQYGRDISRQAGFGTVDQARITTAVSELARNIYLYSEKGQICFETIEHVNQKGMCIISIDSGPGLDDISQVMADGYSTSGGLGAGLPGVKRLMDQFDIKSDKSNGTEIKATKWVR